MSDSEGASDTSRRSRNVSYSRSLSRNLKSRSSSKFRAYFTSSSGSKVGKAKINEIEKISSENEESCFISKRHKESEEELEGEDLDNIIENEKEHEVEEEEEENNNYRSRKKRKHKVASFIIDEAEVDDDVVDDDEWEEGVQEINIVGNEMDELGPTAREIERRRRGINLWNSQKEDEIEKYLRKKYANESTAADRFGNGEEMSDEITQQTLLPSAKDPSLWMIKCNVGQEKATVLLLMRKFLAHRNSNEPLQIKSVVAPEGLKGYIYIEAYKQSHVKAAIENVGNLKTGMWKQQMIPIKEMTDVMRIVKMQTYLKAKQWVRLKRGIYKDDLAQIDYVDLAQNQVYLKLLPRIDYTRFRGALRTAQSEFALKRKKKKRPPAKPFDPEAIRVIGGEIISDGDFFIFEGNRYNRKGFLYKNFVTSAIIVGGIKPTLSELERFEEVPENVEINLCSTPGINIFEKRDQLHSFTNEDNVEVCEGELINLKGKVIFVNGNIITVMPKHNKLKDALEFQASELRKYFMQGDHVKVITGRYEGDTGLIVRVEQNRVVLFSDLSMHELEVRPKDLQLCSYTATGVDSLGHFQWGDLVELDAQTVGVIVRLEHENFHVLSMHGKVVEARPQGLTKRRENRHAVALDSQQNTIQKKDIVKVVDGPHAGRGGEIKHLYRSFAFLYSRIFVNNGGIFVCKTRHLQLSGGNKNTPIIPISPLTGLMSPKITSPIHPSGDDFTRAIKNDSGIDNIRRDRKLIGTTIKITVGPYKGNVGIIKDATNETVRVELHSTGHIISVDRSHIANVSISEDGSFSSYNKTPTYRAGGQTPMFAKDGLTPMHGSQTPMYEYGCRTPHGSMTPSQDGLRTPNQSEIWDPTVNTPAKTNDFEEQNNNIEENSSSNYAYSSTGGSFIQTPSSMYGSKHSSDSCQSNLIRNATANSSRIDYMATSPTDTRYSNRSYDAFMTSPSVNYNFSPSSPYNPQTDPDSEIDTNIGSDWHTTNIEVRIRDTHDNPALAGQHVVIQEISNNMCTVYLPIEDRVIMNLACEQVEPVVPSSGDRIKVILGEDREAVGILLSIDNQEGVVKLNTDEIKFLQLRFLCKMKDK